MSFYEVHLTGSAVSLRELKNTDFSDMQLIVGDPRITLSLSFDTKTPSETAIMLADIIKGASGDPREEYCLAVDVDGMMVGYGRIGMTGGRTGELGVAIREDRSGCGHATDTVQTLLSFAFCRLELCRVTAAIGPDNSRSIRVVERLGFTYEDKLRDHVFTNGAWRDSLLYSMRRYDWVKGRQE